MPKFLRLLRYLVLLGILGVILAASGLGIAYWVLAPRLPSVIKLRSVQMQVPLRVLSADGKLIATFGETRRIPVDLEQVPLQLREAFLAAEDSGFYQHGGIDYLSTLRAAMEVVIHGGKKVQGGSTITQQVARNFFLSPEKSYTRKIMEWFLAYRIEHALSKNEILQLYLNKIFLGHHSYGVAAAAQYYYGKTLQQLSLAESAMLGGLPQAPSAANPVTNSKRALERRNYVLNRMLANGFISHSEYQQALQTREDAAPHKVPVQVHAPYVAEMVRLAAISKLGAKALTDGYVVYTTLNSQDQNSADNAIRKGLLAYAYRHGWHGPESRIQLPANADQAILDHALSGFYTVAGLIPGIVTQSDARSAHVYLQNGQTVVLALQSVIWAKRYINENRTAATPRTVKQVLKRGDIVRIDLDGQGHWQLTELPKAQAALLSMNPDNGAIRALVGGFSYRLSQFNRATQMARQPGSSFKPFLYSAAFQRGFTPASVVNDAPLIFTDPAAKKGVWTPANDNEKFQGPTRLRVALAQSKNLVTIRLVNAIGVGYARRYAMRFGFHSDALPDNLSIALGTASVSPLQMARGYAVFANGGYLVDPYFIKRIVNRNGKTIYIANPWLACNNCPQRLAADTTPSQSSPASATVSKPRVSPAIPTSAPSEPGKMQVLVPAPTGAASLPLRLAPRVIGPRNDYLITSLMQSVIHSGTGTAALVLKRTDLSGKTGTTNDYRDGWFGGFNAGLVTTVWMGFDNYTSLGHADGHPEFGAYVALPIWINYMRTALAGKPENAVAMPPGIVTGLINRQTGLPASPADPLAIREIFRVEDWEKLKALSPPPKNPGQKKSYDVF